MSAHFSRILLIVALFFAAFQAEAQFTDPRDYCDHPLNPMRAAGDNEKSWWSYIGTEGGISSAVRQVQSIVPVAIDKAMAVLTTTLSIDDNPIAQPIPSIYICSPAGLEAVIPGPLAIPLPYGEYSVKLTTESQEGVVLPSFDQMQEGSSWEAHYVYKLTVLQSDIEKWHLTLDVAVMSRVAGFADVVLPEQTFSDTWVVENEYTIEILKAANARGREVATPSFTWNAFQTQYLAEGVGMVRQEKPTTQRLGSSLDVVDYYIPGGSE